MNTNTRKQELEEQITALRIELNEITDAEAKQVNKSFAGRCFKSRNNYSCPEKPSDYWWLYIRVVDVSDGVTVIHAQRDKDGRITIEPSHYVVPQTLERYKEITRGEWNAAYAEILAAANALAH